MLKEIAIADAYGAGFEFSPREKINKLNNLRDYQSHDLYGFCGKYTDDTQMSMAIAELLISEPIWSDNLVASKFVECFKRDPRKGYSKGFYNLLNEVSTGDELLKELNSTSQRNGAAMRSVPLGTIKKKDELISKATIQASITHNTDIAIKSSCAVAMTAHFGLHSNGRISEIIQFLASESLADWDFNWKKETSMSAYDTVSAAFSCLISCRNLKELMIMCVSLGGDTDSVASIAVGLATCFEEYEINIPANLELNLDEQQFGIEYLEALDERLSEYRD